MEQKKTRFWVKYSLIFGIASFLGAVLIFFLTKNGVIHKQTVENPDLSQGISYAVSLILLVLYLVAQMVISFCTAIFGAVGLSSLKKNKNIRLFSIIVSVIELVFSVFCLLSAITVFDFKFIVGGTFALICSLGAAVCVVSGVFSAIELRAVCKKAL